MITWNIDADDDFFLGENKRLVHVTYQQDKRTVQDISNWALSWMLKASLDDDDEDALLVKTSSSGGIALTTPTSGVSTITIDATDTEDLTPGTYYHAVKRTDGGNKTVLSHGRIVLKRGVHRES